MGNHNHDKDWNWHTGKTRIRKGVVYEKVFVKCSQCGKKMKTTWRAKG